ncbi:sensor histidine kinase [Gorillibacterium timonense]|uniref:sensor histidine kinase n=1 Tax=Gorillibacterium timonense TaxID=1689269 RepID=UPI00071DB1B4|nr:histidine kinase [Gorillibacterium timonense]
MRPFWTKKRFIPFTYKIMIPYLILVLLTDLLIGYISYTMLVESRTEMAETNIRTLVKQTRNNMTYQMDEIQRMSDTLFSSLSLQTALQFTGNQRDVMLNIRDNIVPQMKGPLLLYGNNLRLALYTVNEEILEVPGDDMAAPIQRRDYYVLNFSRIVDTDWFRYLQGAYADNLWIQLGTDKELGNLSHFRKLVTSGAGPTVIGYVQITARLDDLLSTTNNTFPFEQGMRLRLFDNQGRILYEKGHSLEGTSKDQSDYLSIEEDMPDTGFVMEAQVPHTYLNKDASRLQRVIVAICGISFVVMAGIGFVVARVSGKKMKRILKLVRSFKDGNLEKRIEFTGNDEFVHIANSFNQMATSIELLIHDVYEQGQQKKQAELDALQAQISPHFLYNTLSAIGSLSNLGEVQKVTQMVQALSRFYRLTLSEGQSVIPLEKELEQVEAYLEIQRVKYADAFTVTIDIEPEIRPLPIIKLILQPFVENVFKHAWFGETIAIRITGKRLGELLELKVIDNGIGMQPEALQSLLKSTVQASGYGLKNVEDRIKLRYGPEYGIKVRSLYGAGTTIRILLPVQDQQLSLDESDP